MKLAVQIPALNEEKTIRDIITNIPKDISGIDETFVVVIDDGSSDNTIEVASSAGAHVISHKQTRGVGAAFRSGLEFSTEQDADIVVTIDADGQFDPQDIAKLIEPILRKRADFVTASRFVDESFAPDMPKLKRWGNNFMARWVSSLIKQRFYDVSCGFRAYSKDAFLRLVLLGEFTYTQETFLNLAFAGVRIQEVPIHVRGTREHGKSRVADNLFNYGMRTATIILKTYRDHRPLKFFSQISLILMIIGMCFFGFLMYVKFTTGGFTPHKWAGFAAGACAGAGLGVFLVGIVAEMLDRIRAAQDEILFRLRRLENTSRKK